jgi:hypothetical protein
MAPDPVRIRKHEAVPQTGSYEVCFADGRSSAYFYWDDVAGRRLAPNLLTGAGALEQARALARAESSSLSKDEMSNRNENCGRLLKGRRFPAQAGGAAPALIRVSLVAGAVSPPTEARRGESPNEMK